MSPFVPLPAGTGLPSKVASTCNSKFLGNAFTANHRDLLRSIEPVEKLAKLPKNTSLRSTSTALCGASSLTTASVISTESR